MRPWRRQRSRRSSARAKEGFGSCIHPEPRCRLLLFEVSIFRVRTTVPRLWYHSRICLEHFKYASSVSEHIHWLYHFSIMNMLLLTSTQLAWLCTLAQSILRRGLGMTLALYIPLAFWVLRTNNQWTMLPPAQPLLKPRVNLPRFLRRTNTPEVLSRTKSSMVERSLSGERLRVRVVHCPMPSLFCCSPHHHTTMPPQTCS